MKRLAATFLIFLSCILLVGCSGGERSTYQLIEHFKKSGIDGEFKPKIAQMIGAEEGGGFSGDGFLVEIYMYESSSKARDVEKKGMDGKPVIRNGNLVMLVHRGGEKIAPAFQSF